MGKWTAGIVTTLIVLILTSITGALLKGPIDSLASNERLTAEVQLSSWVDRPKAAEKKPSRKNFENQVQEVRERVLESMASYSSDSFQFARMIVINEGAKEVSDVSVRLREPYRVSEALVIAEDDKKSTYKDIDRIKLPNMKPGDKVTIFMWSNHLSSYDADRIFKTYSSAGSFRMGIDWPKSQIELYQSAVGQFIDEWALWVIAGCVILLVAIMSLVAVSYEVYVKKILKDEKLYYREKERLESEPSKFTPDFNIKPVSRS